MANDVSEQQKSGVLMNAEELSEWHEGYDREDKDNAQGWANEDQLNQRRREETKMAYEQKDNEVTLWKQEKKSEKSPSYSGKGLVHGKEVRAALWNNTIKAGEHQGEKYLKIKFEDPQDQGARPTPPPPDDGDIDF